MSALLVDPTLVLSEDSESEVHGRCDDESSSSDDVLYAGTVQQNPTHSPLVDASAASEQESDSGSLIFDTMAGAWTFVPLTLQTAQVALDAVRYQKNYARIVTMRLCLHYINTIRVRMTSGVMSYLISVDGCGSTQVVATGRCDIYYCRPYTYELQLTQQAIGSTVFTVQSIYKTVDQKSLDELREDSNLDFSTAPDVEEGVIRAANIPLRSKQPVAWQGADDNLLEGLDDEQPIAWTGGVNTFWESQPIATQQQATAQPLTLRAEPLSMTATHPELVNSDSSGATTVSIIGIAAVAVSTIAFVVALVMVRWRARRSCGPSQEYSPLRRTLNTSENTISMVSRDSVGGADSKPDFEKVELFG